ncbi:hypothetical protein ATZ33_03775 [Enterococcus silesiacus]|uniref:Oxidoreductase, aryl-alcohol dehydrogenase like protein n=1 Tax=Enterococcus silesiacus TaxID=332949 RepID=A0A0S3K8H6_9ENTE|nr:aldo/keto reductase [Enterococcus silesiacus]ALS00520.1 hypothetical protein ATZ33_03775 [Enterococcus silesiacus]OJG91239.1 oxidoreductase, aryl-alcohol dehydrogenase like protein [Enterococcus silesiacus]
MQKRKIGNDFMGEIGLGCMGMTHAYGPSDENENLNVLAKALEIGCNFWDTADFYSAGKNEELLAKALKNNRKHVFLATKVGNVYDQVLSTDSSGQKRLDGSPEYIKNSIERSLKRLKTDYVDLYYLHRVDPLVPIEETIYAMAELVKEGKVRYLGLSEASAKTIKRANSIHPITALQSEYSIWYRELEKEIIPLCNELAITLVPFAPLGRGYLTGTIQQTNDLSAEDWRNNFPRFKEETLIKNRNIVDVITTIAKEHKCKPAVVALAWLLTKNKNLIPIPGTRHIDYLVENTSASKLRLSVTEMNKLSEIKVYGERFPSNMEQTIDK